MSAAPNYVNTPSSTQVLRIHKDDDRQSRTLALYEVQKNEDRYAIQQTIRSSQHLYAAECMWEGNQHPGNTCCGRVSSHHFPGYAIGPCPWRSNRKRSLAMTMREGRVASGKVSHNILHLSSRISPITPKIFRPGQNVCVTSHWKVGKGPEQGWRRIWSAGGLSDALVDVLVGCRVSGSKPACGAGQRW